MKSLSVGMLRVALAVAMASMASAGRELPDDLTVNVGNVENVGTNVTLVLTKRSMRADNCRVVLWTDDGFKDIDIPVTTYRGYVQDDPLMRVNGNIEPGGLLNANFTENRHIIARIRNMNITVPEGKSTRTMSTGNKVVPLASVPRRRVPTPGGYLVPEVPMRRTRWLVQVYATYTSHSSIEKAVSEVEQRMNDGDFVYARDAGTAWEIDTLVVHNPYATKPIDLNSLYPDDPARLENCKWAGFTGAPGRNQGKWKLNVSGIHHEARILLHESAHVYGNPWHQMGQGDGLAGGGAFWDTNNVAILLESQKGAHAALNETNFPAVIYSGELPPRATHDFANTRKDTPVTIDVLENDYSGSGNYPLSLQAVQTESDKGGTVSISEDGKARYTPPPGFVGSDRFTYTVVDSAGVGNRSGLVKVDVRSEGLAVHFDFEKVEKESIEQRRRTNPSDGLLWLYGIVDQRPESEQLIYHFRNLGPYDHGARGTSHWINYLPVRGVRGHGLLNPAGGDSKAQVDLGDVGDPGRASLSASIWVLYPEAANSGGVLLCKGGMPWHQNVCPVNGWSISRNGEGFRFSGNTVRLLEHEIFSLQSNDPIEPNRWYHLVMVMDRETKKLRAYVNNKEVPASNSNTRIPDGVIEYFGPLHVFNAYGGKWWNASQALVDEVKIFTSALTPGQVAELYAEGKNAPVPK